MLRALLILLAFSCVAHADDIDRRTPSRSTRSERRYDYSRYSDGPRQVPVARGASLRRAEILGLGTRASVRSLLRARVEPRWTEAAAWNGVHDRPLIWPVRGGRFGRGFGFTRRERRGLRHNGVDVGARRGTEVRAVEDGIVAYSDNSVQGFGNCIVIVHPRGLVSLYAHHERNTVQAGWRVTRGERIGFVGSTGIARGPHLHFELREGGRIVDPMPFFGAHLRRDEPSPPSAPLAEIAPVPARDEAAAAREEAAPAREPEVVAREPEVVAREPEVVAPAAEAVATIARDAPRDETLTRPAALDGATLRTLRLGSATWVDRLMSRGVPDTLAAHVSGRTFRRMIAPVRGDFAISEGEGALLLEAEPNAPVRAPLDGLVVFAGDHPTLGRTIVLAHPEGTVTIYANVQAIECHVGATVLRGEWIARTATGPLRFFHRVGGRAPASAPFTATR